MRLPRCVFTVLRLMCSSSAISTLVRPARHREQHLLLAPGQRHHGRQDPAALPGGGERGEQPHRDVRRDERVTGGGGVHGLDQQLRPGVLEQEAARARLERTVHVLVQVERRDHDHRERVRHVGSGEPAGGLDAVQLRHPDVEQADVGRSSRALRHRLAAVGGLTHHLDPRLRVEDHRQAGADQLLVVGDQHPDRHATAPVLRQHRDHRPAALRTRAGVERAAQEGRPLGHAHQPVPGPGAALELAVVDDGQAHASPRPRSTAT